MSGGSIGRLEGLAAKTVKSRLHSARGRLRERMQDMVSEEMDRVSEALKGPVAHRGFHRLT